MVPVAKQVPPSVEEEARLIAESIASLDAATFGITNADMVTAGVDADDFLVLMARENANVFCEYVLRDEATGGFQLPQAPHHIEWHRLAELEKRLLIWSHVEAGKTIQLSVGRTLWLLGRNPSLRLAIVSETHDLAKKIVSMIRKYIETSAELRRVFPDMRAAKNEPWTATRIYLERPVLSKDPSVQAFGVHGRIMGARLDGLILDDVLSIENTRTKDARDQLFLWYAQAIGRLTADAFLLIVGNAFHPDDLLHRLSKQDGFCARRFPVMDAAGKSTWVERWPDARIAARRGTIPSSEFARQMMCVARSDEDSKFKQEWIDTCLKRGDGKAFTHACATTGLAVTYTGVDLAVQRHDAADLTVMFTIVVYADGTREILDITSGRWAAPEILDRIVDTHQRYQSLVFVENNAAQDYIVQMLQSRTAIPVRGVTTGRQKATPDFGVEQIGVELANGKWVIPNMNGVVHPEVAAWIDDMLYYDPRAHTGDRLMACYMAWMGIKMGSIVAETGRVNW